MKIDKVDDVAVDETVNEVAHDAAAEQAEGGLGAAVRESQVTPPEVDRHQGAEGKECQPGAPAGEHAPRGAGIADVHEIKQTGEYINAIARQVAAKGQPGIDPIFGQLIEQKDPGAQQPESPVGEQALQAWSRAGQKRKGILFVAVVGGDLPAVVLGAVTEQSAPFYRAVGVTFHLFFRLGGITGEGHGQQAFPGNGLLR